MNSSSIKETSVEIQTTPQECLMGGQKARFIRKPDMHSALCVCVCIVHIDVAHLRKHPRQTTEWFPLKGHKLRLRDTTTKTQGERRRARFM